MKFYRAYVEITNLCGLACSFCPPKTTPALTMSTELFERVLTQLKPYTDEIACHVMGDPLTLSNLGRYLDLARAQGFRVMLTTSGFHLPRHSVTTLLHPAVRQLNVSLNSYNKNDTALSLEAYLAPILALCEAKRGKRDDLFVNLRVWNLDEEVSEKAFNATLFAILEKRFDTRLDSETIYAEKSKSIRLDTRVLLHFDRYFEWPSLDNPVVGDGTCHGLSSQVGILASGDVVPCCLDGTGIMGLGNVKEASLQAILASQRARAIVDGFRASKAVEELCRHCSYKERFNPVP